MEETQEKENKKGKTWNMKTIARVTAIVLVIIVIAIVIYIFTSQNQLVNVLIPPGLRKEEIANILTDKLAWTTEEKNQFLAEPVDPNYTEGVYFPDTYLIPKNESPATTTNRLIGNFNEQFAPFAAEALSKNIKWTTILTLASIVQREAASASDMPLVAGILWKRLEVGMRLEADSTVQYARGDTGNGYWAPITVADESINSPFNTYKYSGLPPHPISNPGLDAIKAVLNPTTTDCLYYLHDSSGTIHCSATYAEHQATIKKYLQ